MYFLYYMYLLTGAFIKGHFLQPPSRPSPLMGFRAPSKKGANAGCRVKTRRMGVTIFWTGVIHTFKLFYIYTASHIICLRCVAV